MPNGQAQSPEKIATPVRIRSTPPTQLISSSYDLPSHRAEAAFLAISLRCSGVSESALAFPPFSPPSRPSVTALGFLFGSAGSCFGISPMAFWNTSYAIWLKSFGPWPRLPDLFGITSSVGRYPSDVNPCGNYTDPLPTHPAI
jgi:hypothetical protein